MKRINTINREIDKFGPGKDGFRAAAPGVSEPTYLSAEFCNAVQEGLVRVIEAAGLVPSDDKNQFLAAINMMTAVPLTRLAESGGAELVGFGSTTVADTLREFVSIRTYGAVGDGAHDDQPAFQLARFDSDRIYFPRVNGADTTYYLGSAPVEMITGTILYADPGVTISWPAGNNYHLFDNVRFESDIKCTFRDSQTHNYIFTQTPLAYQRPATMGAPTRRRRKALNCANLVHVNLRKVQWPGGDTFTAAAGAATYDSISMGANAGSFSGAFVRLGVYESVPAYFNDGLSHGPIGVMLRGTGGYMVVYAGTAAGNFYTAIKRPGQPVEGNIPDLAWSQLGQGRYTSFAPDRSIWSVTKIDTGRVVIKLNGKAISKPFTEGIGEIYEVGFVSFSNAPYTISGLSLERRIDALVGGQELAELRIFGDSTAAPMPSSWDKHLKPLLDGLYGIKVGTITNFANVGDTFAQQYVAMTQNGFGNAYFVLVVLGVNNAQGGQPIPEFRDQVRTVFTEIQSKGRQPIVAVPGMYYGIAQSGGVGQNTANYDAAAPYRLWVERIASEMGIAIVNIPQELPNPDPLLLTSTPTGAILRDNIHQDALGHLLYARAFGQAILDAYVSLPESVEESMAPHMLGTATAGSDLALCYGKDSLAMINGTVGVTGVVDGADIFTVPRYVGPTKSTNISATALTDALVPNGTCWVNIDISAGVARLHKPPAGTAFIILYAAWKIDE